MSAVTIQNEAERPTAVVHEVVPVPELPAFFARALTAVMAAAAEQGVAAAGPPFALYRGMPGLQGVDVEAGFPVTGEMHAAGNVVASRLPGGRTATAVHVGPYELLSDTYMAVCDEIVSAGLRPCDQMWEEYLSDPATQPDPQTWRTVVHWPAHTGDAAST
jgi:effector-binding domain-containing protein